MADKAYVALYANGLVYEAWQDVSISMGIDHLVNEFTLQVSNRWSNGRVISGPPVIQRGTDCRLTIDSETVITGRVLRAAPSFNKDQWKLSITGRDRAELLVRCSVELAPLEWRGLTALEIVTALTKPYGIPVMLAADQGLPIETFALQAGEKVFAAIDRLCRMRSLLPFSDGKGGLVLGRAGNGRHAGVLHEARDIVLDGSGDFSHEDRFSEYRVMESGGMGEPGTEGIATARDTGLPYYAPLTVLAEMTGDDAAFKTRAQWEANTRMGRSDRVIYNVSGWRDGGFSGSLWRVNYLVPVQSPGLGISADMLIKALTFTQNDNEGSRTNLQLTRPEAYQPQPSKPQKGLW